MTQRGNVLFITVDQWRGDCMSAAGHAVVETPTLDALARRGVRFANHWANIAPCGPSRATLHTGMYAMNHRSVLNGTPLDDRFTNTAREAQRAGYRPVLFGYTDTTVDPRSVPADDPRLSSYEEVLPGFDAVAFNPESAGSPGWARWLAAQGFDVPSRAQDLYLPLEGFPGAERHASSWAPTRFPAELSETAYLVAELRRWFEQHGDGDPWFVHASFIRPHPPYRNPVGYHDLYDPEAGGGFKGHARRDDALALHPVAALATELPGVGCPIDDRERRQLRATYWGAMREVDDQLGVLCAWMASQGLLDDTLVVLTSDHGDQMGDHWLVQKLGWWDESYRVPLIVVDPRAQADATRGGVVTAVTEHVDLLPTLCTWMGVEVPLQCDGQALQPFLHAEASRVKTGIADVAAAEEKSEATAVGGGAKGAAVPAGWRTAAHWEWDFRDPAGHAAEDLLGLSMEQCGLGVWRDERWKYVVFGAPPDVLPPLLFDLVEDPEQTVNLAADPAYADARAACADAMLRWRMVHADRTLTGHVATPVGMQVRRDARVAT